MPKKNPPPSISDQALQAVTQGEEHFLIRAHPRRVLTWIAGPDGAWEYAGGEWPELTGRPSGAELGWGWLDHVAGEDRERIEREYRACIGAGRAFRGRYQTERGEARLSVISEGQPRRDGDGCCGWIGFALWAALTPAESRHGEHLEPAVRELLSALRLPGLVLSLHGRVLYCNEPLASALGLPAEKVIGRHWGRNFLVPDCARRFGRSLENRSCWGDYPVTVEACIIDVLGRQRIFTWRNTVLRDSEGHARAVASIGEEITAHREVESSVALTAKVFESSVDAMLITDRSNNIVAVNDAFCRLTGFDREEVIGCNPRVLKSGRHEAEFYREMWREIVEQGFWRGEVWDRRKDGSVYPKSLAISTIRDEVGEITNYSATFFDITERKRAEERLEFLAHYDPLTRLPNRALLQDRIEVALARARRDGKRIAVMFLDLDRFKEINDRYGHTTGDELLQAVAGRLRSCLRGADTVARLGGDEFVVVLPDLDGADPAAEVAGKLLQALAEPYQLREHFLSTSPSIGISLFPDDHHDIGMLMKGADKAMYAAKRSGRAGYAFWGDLPPEKVEAGPPE